MVLWVEKRRPWMRPAARQDTRGGDIRYPGPGYLPPPSHAGGGQRGVEKDVRLLALRPVLPDIRRGYPHVTAPHGSGDL
ncbi:hypothetical protein COMA2_310003 [Candidatus Nitrospira nitrificans]|uniref:Uncharacterized protein n=1 Tax=Candidatus Nitrospira nitrificans TaxID=1742973 RepID=A0A0S4LJA1_9BACT|nr:hypothetical protein COMA2_310003 [Candidatus Nitrospira nitrificans]